MKSPAFQVYAADFLADKNTAVMSAEEVGAYWLLILYCWREGTLPSDIEELAALSRVPVERFSSSWERRIARCFAVREDGLIVHPRLELEREHQAVNREKKRHAALSRYNNSANPNQTNKPGSDDDADAVQVHSVRSAGAYQTQSRCSADAVQMECPSSSSSSSSATAKKNPSLSLSLSPPGGPPAEMPPAAAERERGWDGRAGKGAPLSRHPFDDCLAFVRCGPVVKSAVAVARTIWQDGSQDALIDDFKRTGMRKEGGRDVLERAQARLLGCEAVRDH
jgi:uncharacterized protein YdaU (DUF1376 family)